MKRRKFIVGLGSLAAGGAAALGTGAGNVATVKDRDVTIDVTRDADAWLALRPANGSNPPENVFADASGDKLVLDLGDSGAGFAGQGPNTDAVWKVPNIFGVSNTYVRDLDIWITVDNFPNGSPVFAYYTTNTYPAGSPPDPVSNRSSSSNKKNVAVGNTQNFGLYIDTTNVNLGDKNLEMTIHADESP